MTVVAAEAPMDLRHVWRRVRLPVVVAGLAVGVAVGVAAVESAPPPTVLGPGDASPVGARAIVTLLRARGVDVTAVLPRDATSAARTATTVVVPDPASLSVAQLRALSGSGADLVVIAPQERELDALGMRRARTGTIAPAAVEPGCAFPPAVVAGRVRVTGDLYAARSGDQACYPFAGAAALLVHDRPDGARTTVFGSRSSWSNAHLADQGDAALALGVLGRQPRAAWLLPQPATAAAADARRKGVVELLPARLWWALLQVVVVVALVAVWRGRRLGPLVPERLPSPVHAAETVLGRARLMRAARARGRAADALRTAVRSRLAERLGLGPSPERSAVVGAVSRVTARPPIDVDTVLYGAEPTDDAALVRLAGDIDTLESALRQALPTTSTTGGPR